MSPEDVLALLVYATELDGRHAPNAMKVAAWQDVINESAAGMTREFAQDQVRMHYARTSDMFAVSSLVSSWSRRREFDSAKKVDSDSHESHCGRQGCACVHERGCFRGWHDFDDRVVPCGVCRPGLLGVLEEIPSPGGRGASDFTRLRMREVS